MNAVTPTSLITPKTEGPLKQGNTALRAGKLELAIQHYLAALAAMPGLSNAIAPNLSSARQKYRASRNSAVKPSVAVCGWELSHNAAGRVYTLAMLYETFAEVEIIGSHFPALGREIWEPIRDTSIAKHSFVVEDEAKFIDQAIALVAAHPYDIVHLSKPRAPNIIFGILYKLIWDAKVLMDIDDEELAFVGADTPISVDDYIQQHRQLPELKDLAGKDWTRLAVGLVKEFDGITVCNTPLQLRYGGDIIRHARDEKLFKPSPELKRQSREKYGIPQDKKVVLFFGTPSEHKGLIETALAISQLKRPEILFCIVGEFSDPALKKKLQDISGCQFAFLPTQSNKAIPEVVSVADCCVLIEKDDKLMSKFHTPATFSEAFGMSVPVISNLNLLLAESNKFGAMLLAKPNELSLQIASAIDSNAYIQKTALTGKAFFDEELTIAGNSKRLHQFLEANLSESRTSILKVNLTTFAITVAANPLMETLMLHARQIIVRNKAISDIKKIQHQTTQNFSSKKETKPNIKQYKFDECIKLINSSKLFDSEYYLNNNPDLKNAKVNPARHFHMHGWKERRNPSAFFDIEWYCNTYPEVLLSQLNPLIYYIEYGESQLHQITPRAVKLVETKSSFINDSAFGPVLNKPWVDENQILKLLSSSKIEEMLTPELIDLTRSILHHRHITISVIMPMWNRANSICDSLNSALRQTYPPAEIIVIDDGSTDESCAIVEKNYHNEIKAGLIKLVRNEHLGVSAARNTGLRCASYELIAYLDSDNNWRSDYLLIMAAMFASAEEICTAYASLLHQDNDKGTRRMVGVPYDRKHLLHSNFIDMNVFMHRRYVQLQIGYFDESLKRLVDWDFIIRCTELYPPVFVPYCGVDYFIDEKRLGNITLTIPLEENKNNVLKKHSHERIRQGLTPLRIAYVLWDWPALSQTFVLEEITWLLEQGQDVIVYYKIDPDKPAKLDIVIEAHKVNDHEHLIKLMIEHKRTLCHSHFAYPAVTLLAYPACTAIGIPFTLAAHAVDIFHVNNRKRNLIAKIANEPLCLKIFVPGEYHRSILVEDGVPIEKLFYNLQAIKVDNFKNIAPKKFFANNGPLHGICIARFVEKKGIEFLIAAAGLLRNEPVVFDIYGYGPLEKDYREQIQQLNISNINFMGALEGTDALVAAYERADFVLVPSVIAQNGDTEGFPTVIFEAMASSRPVVLSAVSSVPDYLQDMVQVILVEQKSAHSLADGIKRLIGMSESRRCVLIDEAKKFIEQYVDIKRTMSVYFDVWRKKVVDIFIVTFNRPGYENATETFEIIERILKHTNSPFVLTIIDNDSDATFRKQLIELSVNKLNIRLIFKNSNVFCGPASNIALSLAEGKAAIYICSKEGFICKHGWERTLIRHLGAHSEHAMAGYKTHLPRFTLGSELVTHPEFSKFRNQGFAISNPNKVFSHIQGGIYIIRRSVLFQLGLFSAKLPHNGMDIEFSYFLESEGCQLGSINGVASITTKTLPKLVSVIDENTVCAHPLTIDSVTALLDNRVASNLALCNFCSSEISQTMYFDHCERCGSTPFGRKVYKRLAHDWRTHRGSRAVLITNDTKLAKELNTRMFNVIYFGVSLSEAILNIKKINEKIELLIIDIDILTDEDFNILRRVNYFGLFPEFFSETGLLLFSINNEERISLEMINNLFLSIKVDHSSKLDGIILTDKYPTSRLLRFDWRPLHEIDKSMSR